MVGLACLAVSAPIVVKEDPPLVIVFTRVINRPIDIGGNVGFFGERALICIICCIVSLFSRLPIDILGLVFCENLVFDKQALEDVDRVLVLLVVLDLLLGAILLCVRVSDRVPTVTIGYQFQNHRLI